MWYFQSLKSQMKLNNYNEFKHHILDCYPNEGCGFVIDDVFVPCKNVSKEPLMNFEISNDDYLNASLTGKLTGLLHSHCIREDLLPILDNCRPTYMDLCTAGTTALEMGIVATNGTKSTKLVVFNSNAPEPLIGRPYLESVYDCYTLVRDYFLINKQVKLPIIPRDVSWRKTSPTLFNDNLHLFLDLGFKKVEHKNELKEGDALLFSHNMKNTIDHSGVYVGNGKYIHHGINKLSQEDWMLKCEQNLVLILRKENI